MMHEAKCWEQNCFVTLTYSDEHLPEDYGLHHRDVQLFFKRLRKRYSGKKIRFFVAGEYGGLRERPHYHAILFNHDFLDKDTIFEGKHYSRYKSEELEALWRYGRTEVGDFSLAGARYTAQYILKKYTGEDEAANQKYSWFDPHTGKEYMRRREYCAMSKRPGIGYEWFMKYWQDYLPCDFIVFDNVKYPVPRYYLKLYEELGENAKAVSGKRVRLAKQHKENNTPDRLAVREKVAKAKVDQRKGDLRQ